MTGALIFCALYAGVLQISKDYPVWCAYPGTSNNLIHGQSGFLHCGGSSPAAAGLGREIPKLLSHSSNILWSYKILF